MKRSEFLALMVSPLILPFVKKKSNPYAGHSCLQDGEWHNVCEVWDNGTKKTYIDGIYSIDGMTETIWYDSNHNGNNGVVSGAVLLNKGKI